VYTLSDLPSLMDTPSCITVHGLGKGGGELVSKKISKIFDLDESQLIGYSSGTLSLIKSIFQKGNRSQVFCTAGPRDIFVIILCAITFHPAYVYLQVPYHKTISWKDPIHLFLVGFFQVLVLMLTRTVFVNSKNSRIPLSFRQQLVILPITEDELSGLGEKRFKSTEPKNLKSNTIYLVGRYNKERGLGSRDLKGVTSLAQEVAEYNKNAAVKLSIVHYGESDPEIRTKLMKESNSAITFNGFLEDWVPQVKGDVLFLSNYEGFGLAAFEASKAGLPVYVNEAFPKELISSTTGIKRVYSLNTNRSILTQMGRNQ
jgi:hypothetical protein